MNKTIAIIKGDGIGPEIVTEAMGVLDAVAAKFGHTFTYVDAPMGGNAIDKFGVPLPDSSLVTCRNADSVLLGAVGGAVGHSKWDAMPPHLRPEKALLGIREALGLFTNLRPAKLYPALKSDCPLREDIVAKGFDIMMVRELTGGIYFGERGRRTGKYGEEAYDTECYSRMEIERIAKVAFETAQKRNKNVISIDKANVLESSRLWREVVHEVAKDYPEVEVSDMLVDNCAMQLVMNPGQFDVILTENMFGDILSDEASMITGSIGMLSSASLGKTKLGLYEPSHGSAPDIAGKNIANPIATILSAAMMLRYSLDLDKEADAIEAAVAAVLKEGYRTTDIYSDGCTKVGTDEMGDLIAKRV